MVLCVTTVLYSAGQPGCGCNVLREIPAAPLRSPALLSLLTLAPLGWWWLVSAHPMMGDPGPRTQTQTIQWAWVSQASITSSQSESRINLSSIKEH